MGTGLGRLWNEHTHLGFGRKTQNRQGKVERREDLIDGPNPRDRTGARDEQYY